MNGISLWIWNQLNVATSANVLMFVCPRVHANTFCPICCRALKSNQNSLCSLLIVDTPGFQNPRLAKRECSATFEDLCHNYTQERLHTLFYQRTFVQELERYKEVGMWSFMHRAYIWPHCLILPPAAFSVPLCLLLSLRHINSNSVCVHISDTPSLPPVTSSDKQSSLR